MNWFLSLFPAYNALRGQLQEAQSRELILQDRLDGALDERQKIWDMLQEALNGERTAYQAHVNVEWQRKGFGAPYPEAPHLDSSAVPQQSDVHSTPRRRIGSELVADGQRKFIEELRSRSK